MCCTCLKGTLSTIDLSTVAMGNVFSLGENLSLSGGLPISHLSCIFSGEACRYALIDLFYNWLFWIFLRLPEFIIC